MNKNKIILFIFLILCFILFNNSNIKKDSFETYLLNKDWDKIKNVFFDDSYRKLMQPEYSGKIIYIKQKVKNSYEIILINNKKYRGKSILVRYSKIENRFGNLMIDEILPNFFLFKGYDIFKINNIKFKIADSSVFIKKGYLFIPKNLNAPYIFNGKIRIKVSPMDKEEKAQFKHLFNHFEKTFKMKWLILFSKNITIKNRVKIKRDNIVINRQANKVFRVVFSFKLNNIKNITPFILPNENDNMMMFPLKGRKLMMYIHNKNRIPDTQLYGLNFKKILSDYNYYKTPKFIFESSDSIIKEINIQLYPTEKSVKVKEWIKLREKTRSLSLQIPKNIDIKKIYSPEEHEILIFNNMKNLYINGLGFKNLYIEYTVGIEEKEELDMNFSSNKNNVFNIYAIGKKYSNILFLSRDSSYYLKDRLDFFKVNIKVNYDNKRCFSAGEELNKNEFQTDAVKGFPLICGNFSPVLKIKDKSDFRINYYSNIPLNNKIISELSIAPEITEFYKNLFGRLDWNKINMVFSENRALSALSYRGLIYIKGDSRKFNFNYANSPVKFTNNLIDIISHEIAHQWWGGLISWKTYRDIWITEGFATFSEILYLKHRYGDSEFKKIIRKMKRSVLKKYRYGPLYYGKRVGNWEEDGNAYFSIIYNKSSLMLLMLKEIMGKEKFFKRVKQFLKKYRYKSISTPLFISFFSEGDKIINKFLKVWIYSRDIPKIKYKIKTKGRNIIVNIKQIGNNTFLFPLRLQIKVKNKTIYKKFLITKKEQKIELEFDYSPASVKLDNDWITPIK